MLRRLAQRLTIGLAALVLAAPTVALGDPTVFAASGQAPADIQGAVDDFRAALGTNNGVGGSFPGGRREINWDGVPDAFSAPNNMPANFFNPISPPPGSPRGAVFFTPGSGFQVSADSDNPTNTPIEFGNLRPDAPKKFRTFSAPRLFTALDSPIVEVLFFVPGTSVPATTRGFGAVFTDVDRDDITKIEYFDVQGTLLMSRFVPRAHGKQTLSFLGVLFDTSEVYVVRITSGDVPLGEKHHGGKDVVVMDDFIYGEPQRQPPVD
jgi:hypothetical protein